MIPALLSVKLGQAQTDPFLLVLCLNQILSDMATGFFLHKQLQSYEELAFSNSLLIMACSVGVPYKPLKMKIFQ